MKTASRFQGHRRPEDSSLVGDWLGVLGVNYTTTYTLIREKAMPFKTWFGLSRLLEEYGVASAAYTIPDRSKLPGLPTPFIAHISERGGGNVIVTDIRAGEVDYLSLGQPLTVPIDQFLREWDGNVFFSHPQANSGEPEYRLHRRLDFFTHAKKWVLLLCGIILLIYAFIANGIYVKPAAYFITLFDLGGLYVTYLLVQKSLRIHNPKADKFCGILQEGGCDDILSTSASKFFGLFGWSEVGFAYFSVSLLSLLLFPASLPALALCNLACLPFTVWSIWYQRFKAHRWCTLCVTVQSTLWLLFFSYLAGGYVGECFYAWKEAIVLGFVYLGVMLLINALMPLVQKDPSTANSDKL